MAQLVTSPRIQAIDANGNPIVGALLYIYDAGTVTPRTTYSDAELTTPNANPMVASNALAIFGPIFVSTTGADLKFEVRTADGIVIPELGQDDVPLSQLTAEEVNDLVNPVTEAESAAGVTPLSKRYVENNAFRYMTAAQITAVLNRTLTVDVADAIRNLVRVCRQNGAKGYCPAGSYLIRSTASDDSLPNGIHISFTSVFGYDQHLSLEGDGRSTVFYAGDNNMTVFRLSDSHTRLTRFAINGNGKSGVTGISLISSNTGASALAEHIDWNYIDVDVSDCAEGMELEAPSGGGCYWNKVYGSYYNNTRHVRLRDHATSKGANRNEFYLKINGGNTGIYIDGADTNLIQCRFEEVAVGTSPLTTPTAIWINNVGSLGGLLSQNTNIIGCMFEDCTNDLDCSNARTYVLGGNCGESGAIVGSAYPYVLIGGDELTRMREVTFGSPTLDGLTLSPRSSALGDFANAYVGTSADASGSFPFNNDGSLILKSRTSNAAGVAFVTGLTPALRAHIDTNGNFVVSNAALATNATDGFLYVPSCAGTPTGTPTTKTGRVPIVVDTTNHKLYFYDGSWRDAGP